MLESHARKGSFRHLTAELVSGVWASCVFLLASAIAAEMHESSR